MNRSCSFSSKDIVQNNPVDASILDFEGGNCDKD